MSDAREDAIEGVREVSAGLSFREGRVLSVDLFRGVVMFLLIGKVTGFYDLLVRPELDGTFLHTLGLQFHHHPWHGLTLWDLGQPLFMFISGVAMVFSYERRWESGESWGATLGRALRRSGLLVVLGWALYLIGSGGGGFRGAFLFDILPQLGFGNLVAFLLLRRTAWVQAGAVLGLVGLTEMLYRFWPVAGFDQPFVPGHNFGSWLDTALFGAASEESLVTFTIVPAAAFAIMGVIAGGLLKRHRPQGRKLVSLVWIGLAGIAVGLALDPVTPIVRRISTSSFVILAGGLAFLSMALGYWLVDVMTFSKRSLFFVIVGMNPVFIYLFALSGGGDWLYRVAAPFTMAFSGWIGDVPSLVLTSLAVWGLMWGLSYWLYKKKIFIRI